VKRAARWTLLVILSLTAIMAVLAGAFLQLVPADRDLAARIAVAAEQNLGTKVTVGAARMKFWPQPELVLSDVATVQPQPISVKRLVARARISELLKGRMSFERADIEDAVIPQLSLFGLKINPAAPQASVPFPLDQLRFRHLTWITRHDKELEFDGSVLFDSGWQPRQAELVRPGTDFRLALARQDANHWQIDMQLGGGTADGQVELSRDKDGRLQLSGQLEPRNVEVANALDSFKMRSAVLGKASGKTQLSANGDNVGELARTLRTRTTFSMSTATLLHIDVDKAIRTFGKEHAGKTALRALTGRMDTQASPQGTVVRYTNIQAQGDSFTARGEGTIANRHMNGELTVDVAGGLVGVPLKVSGPLGAARVSVPMPAMAAQTAGAAIGTAILPGIGTAIGAGVGRSIGQVMGGKAAKKDSGGPAR
jgi:uncharacterized protein involved in outer membrane biogenesis